MKNILRIAFFVTGSIILTACSSMPKYQNLSTDAEVVNAKKDSPELFKEFTVVIGDNLLSKVSGSYLENKTQSVSLLSKFSILMVNIQGYLKVKQQY